MFGTLSVLSGLLPEPYYSHYAHLVAAVNMLSSDIKEHHLERAEELMKVFCRRIATFMVSVCVINITVEPLNKGHFGTIINIKNKFSYFVPYRGVVLSLEILNVWKL